MAGRELGTWLTGGACDAARWVGELSCAWGWAQWLMEGGCQGGATRCTLWSGGHGVSFVGGFDMLGGDGMHAAGAVWRW